MKLCEALCFFFFSAAVPTLSGLEEVRVSETGQR